jgi:hypothetical protein
VEAKAHVGEFESRCEAVAPASLAKIKAALEATRKALGAVRSDEWMTHYYQYANRLAHLHFLREHGVDATLAFVYFVGDREMPGPVGRSDFEETVSKVRRALRLSGPCTSHVIDVYVDVAALR